MKPIKIAIDGPAGAGKSTVAKRLAKELGYYYIDTGAMYRALTFKALKKKYNINDEDSLKELLKKTTIEIRKNGCCENQIYIDNKNVTYEIRQPEVSNHVSIVAKSKHVRDYMLDLQRKMASQGGVVMDGRDIGSVVLPNAEVKFFLTASLEARAKRRQQELEKKGYYSDLETIAEEIALRDKIDQEREYSPLIQCPDAIYIDTSNYTVDEVVEILKKEIEKKLAEN
ncbi:(d)CMP kinase [Anaerobranca gottschalkii]|uniref:Cytidylate kinase n=1 Tax=Anaerobranca gottschalkii DSM 13577 TaxID=1120990 RepID=A0A1H9YEX7_9FIRM|nr:(d)CMP kinase [Anaerobranca gottschalkii]SES67112.1 cytidylate kinase [Anaerobranca gottschalkii DSM 13577]